MQFKFNTEKSCVAMSTTEHVLFMCFLFHILSLSESHKTSPIGERININLYGEKILHCLS